MLSFHWLEKCVIVKKQKKTQVIWDFPDTSDQFVNPESAAWVYKRLTYFHGTCIETFIHCYIVVNSVP